jgi:DNA-binding NarL/FixJ family response regulator
MLAEDKPIRTISKELDLSQSTVSTHKQRILEKMGFATNADLVRYAAKMQADEISKKRT